MLFTMPLGPFFKPSQKFEKENMLDAKILNNLKYMTPATLFRFLYIAANQWKEDIF